MTIEKEKIQALKKEMEKIVEKYNCECIAIRRILEQLSGKQYLTKSLIDHKIRLFVQRETTMRILQDLEELLK